MDPSPYDVIVRKLSIAFQLFSTILIPDILYFIRYHFHIHFCLYYRLTLIGMLKSDYAIGMRVYIL